MFRNQTAAARAPRAGGQTTFCSAVNRNLQQCNLRFADLDKKKKITYISRGNSHAAHVIPVRFNRPSSRFSLTRKSGANKHHGHLTEDQ